MKLTFKTILKTLVIACGFVLTFASCDKTDNENTDQFTDSRDGHVYKTVTIGAQTWMAENLAYLPFTTLPSTYSSSEPCYYVCDYAAYGVLYNWPAALNSCPAGWHLPSEAEWKTLANYLTNNGYGFEGSGYDIAKSLASSSGWNSSSITGVPGNDPLTNNSCCFSALPGGYYHLGHFKDSGGSGYWWSSTADDEFENVAWHRTLYYYSGGFESDRAGSFTGFSVRCVKN